MRIIETTREKSILDQIKAANSISQSISTDWMKQQEEASRTNRMMGTIDRIAKQSPPQEGVLVT